jgi:hypothetical protein
MFERRSMMSHIRQADAPTRLPSVRVPSGGAQLLLGCDMVVTRLADGVLAAQG